MDTAQIVLVLGFLCQLVAFISSGVWIVANIKGTSTQLSLSLHHLTATLAKLETTMEKVQAKQIDQEIRVKLLERGIVMRSSESDSGE